MFKKKANILTIGIISFIFAFSTIVMPGEGFAEETEETTIGETEEQQINNKENSYVEEEDLEYEEQANSWRYQDGHFVQSKSNIGLSSRASYTPWSKVNGSFVNDKGQVIEGAIRKGIDVSKWQGNIDWEKVKASGIDFAIIRCGYGNNLTKYDDVKWERNVSECERLGIPYGVYLYSYAEDIADARSEAQHVLRLLEGHNPSYPVYYDLEDDVVASAGNATIVNMANTFCSIIESNGYRAGIYANLNWWNNKLNSSSLNKYEKWVAQWSSKCTYTGNYRIWQCTSSGSVPGISGRVDLNFEFWREDTAVDVTDYNAIFTAARNIRTGPYTVFDIVGKVEAGEVLTITHKAGNWGKIKGTDNWVELSYAKTLQDVSDYDVVSISDRNIRTGPETTFEIVGKFKVGETLTITHKAGNWGKIKGTDNWVELSYVKNVQNVTDYEAISTSDRNIRTGPETTFEIVGKFKAGEILTITHKAGNWGKIKGTDNWVELSYAKKIETVSNYQIILTGGRNVRTGPETTFKSTGYYNAGKELTITHKAGDWGKIKGSNNWIELLTSKKIEDVTDYEVISTSDRNIRTGPETTFEIVGKFKVGETLTITHKAGTWGKIKGTNNWVELSYAKPV